MWKTFVFILSQVACAVATVMVAKPSKRLSAFSWRKLASLRFLLWSLLSVWRRWRQSTACAQYEPKNHFIWCDSLSQSYFLSPSHRSRSTISRPFQCYDAVVVCWRFPLLLPVQLNRMRWLTALIRLRRTRWVRGRLTLMAIFFPNAIDAAGDASTCCATCRMSRTQKQRPWQWYSVRLHFYRRRLPLMRRRNHFLSMNVNHVPEAISSHFCD